MNKLMRLAVALFFLTPATGMAEEYLQEVSVYASSCPSEFTQDPVDLNAGTGGSTANIKLCTKYTSNSANAVTSLHVIETGNPAPGYSKIDTDMNKGCGQDSPYLFLTYSRDTGHGSPVKKLYVGIEQCAPDYERIKVDLNRGCKGKYLYFCVKR